MQNSTEKLNRLSKHQESKQASNQIKLEQLKTEFESVSKERASAQEKADDHERISHDMEKKILALNKKMEAEVTALSSDYDELKAALQAYQLGLEKAMNRYAF